MCLKLFVACAALVTITDASCKFDLTITDQTSACKAGTAQKIKAGDKLGMRYKGTIAACSDKFGDNGPGFEFDNSDDHGDGIFRFTDGIGEVIEGWDQGVLGLCVGSKATLTVPARLGYGDDGVPEAEIPGGADLQFEIEVLQINDLPANPIVHKSEVRTPNLLNAEGNMLLTSTPPFEKSTETN
jgi:FKBP-type peptidyl-prolyl cis-trans isomerase 2